MENLIYLDNNSTTQIDKRVLDEIMPFLTSNFANANSTHKFGVGSHDAVKNARKQISNLIGSDTNEIIFTSGATEAINLAIKGVCQGYATKGNHIITVTTEHSAVLDTYEYLEQQGIETTYISVDKDGLIDLEELKSSIKENTILISVMYANNETGVIQPIKEIASMAHQSNILFMTDATQAVGKININVEELDVDLLCFSGHKLYAPKGVGVLYVRQKKRRIKIPALIHGGGHERGLRSGTLNVAGIVALGKACEIAHLDMQKEANKIKKLRDYLESELLKIENTKINGSIDNRLYNVTNICFDGVDSDAIIMGLSNPYEDIPLIAVSNGSACTSASIEPSHVLIAMGLTENEAFNSIRFSLGKFNTKKEIDITIKTVKMLVERLRKMSF